MFHLTTGFLLFSKEKVQYLNNISDINKSTFEPLTLFTFLLFVFVDKMSPVSERAQISNIISVRALGGQLSLCPTEVEEDDV